MPRVLIVDDDEDLLEMVSMILSRAGMDVHSAYKATNLQETILEIKPDLILMDIYLDDLDGRELCREIKLLKEFAKIPIVLYSAGVISDDTIKTSLADEFILKPFNNAQLLKTINALCA
ncbi:MAG TPA: response regulator [Puia sp.]|jgi:DNA-binding response OmpR family regulator|nr:response regulator [Puia sp.]